jgi:probable F420-dependent oxidoreductase
MKIDGALLSPDLKAIPEQTRELEALGYDGVFTFEGPHEPFFPLVLAAEHSKKLELATGLAIAFARTPMTVANLAYDLHRFSEGRFSLALGTQIKPHIERRYSMPWSKPRALMREFVLATQAIFKCWNEGSRLEFEGEFYTHNLMPPMFSPEPNPYGVPPILLGGVGEKTVEMVGEVADGLLVHPLNTPAFLEKITLPAVDRGLATSGRSRSDFTMAIQTLIITGETEQEYAHNRELVRGQIAFYGSTPAYRTVLDAEGWGDLQPELRKMTREGRWQDMQSLVTDEVLDRIATGGTPEEISARLKQRYNGVADRLALASPFPLPATCVKRIVSGLKSGT